jgi:hypothetical protein
MIKAYHFTCGLRHEIQLQSICKIEASSSTWHEVHLKKLLLVRNQVFLTLVETEPSSFEEAVQQPIWVDAMVEEYDSIVRNSVWDVVPRPENKSVVSSIGFTR